MQNKPALVVIASVGAMCGLLYYEQHAQRRELAELREQLMVNRTPEAPSPVPVAAGSQRPVFDAQLVDAMARQVAQRLADIKPVAPAPEPVAPTPQQVHALGEYRRVVDDVIAHGRVTRDEAIAMQREMTLAGLSPEVDELRRKVIVAINTNQLVIDDPRSFMP
jgi:hypothetical protein